MRSARGAQRCDDRERRDDAERHPRPRCHSGVSRTSVSLWLFQPHDAVGSTKRVLPPDRTSTESASPLRHGSIATKRPLASASSNTGRTCISVASEGTTKSNDAAWPSSITTSQDCSATTSDVEQVSAARLPSAIARPRGPLPYVWNFTCALCCFFLPP